MGGDSVRHPFINGMKLKENWSLYYFEDGLNLKDYKSQNCFKNVTIPVSNGSILKFLFLL